MDEYQDQTGTELQHINIKHDEKRHQMRNDALPILQILLIYCQIKLDYPQALSSSGNFSIRCIFLQ